VAPWRFAFARISIAPFSNITIGYEPRGADTDTDRLYVPAMTPKLRTSRVSLRRQPTQFRPPSLKLAPPSRSRHSSKPIYVKAPIAIDERIGNCPGLNPYADYDRTLTQDGTILLTFKAIDDRFIVKVRRYLLLGLATGGEIWFLLHFHLPASIFAKLLCLVAAAVANWFIVSKPVEIYRSIEIRSDGIIFDGRDLFWQRHMENGWPSFQPDPEDPLNSFFLAGTYGTRHVDFTHIRRLDEFDRAPEVLAAHLADAMRQLWQRA